jgi:nickel-dependent lactate racemase
MVEISLPYAQEHLSVQIPTANLQGIWESRVNDYDSGVAESAVVERALDQPIGSLSLEQLVAGKRDMVIITSDHTRPVPSALTLPILLRRIRAANPEIKISILIATGFHRATTHEEMVAKFGAEIVTNERLIVHDSQDRSQLVNMGTLPSGGEFWLNRLAVETELLISEGFIEPHFFAGFSGGRKSVLPGVAGAETILANHCAEFIASEQARTGLLEDNPIHRDMLYAARQANLRFILNVVLNDRKQVIHAVAGDLEKAHLQGCEFLKGLCQIPHSEADIVITSNGGYPLDQNIYQAVKGMTAAESAAGEDGVIIMVAACNDGHGGQSFYEQVAAADTPRDLLARTVGVPRDRTVPDQWEYQILARILSRHPVLLVSKDCPPEMIRTMHMEPFASIEQALQRARQIKGENARISVIPDGVAVIGS